MENLQNRKERLPQILEKKAITKINQNNDESDDEFGLKDDPDLMQIELDVGGAGEENDDDDFFDGDDDKQTTRYPANSILQHQQKPQQVVSLPKLDINKLSSEMTDFKKLMTLTLEEQKKKNQIGEQIIAERVDESEDDDTGRQKETTIVPATGYRSRLSKITRLADESTHAHK